MVEPEGANTALKRKTLSDQRRSGRAIFRRLIFNRHDRIRVGFRMVLFAIPFAVALKTLFTVFPGNRALAAMLPPAVRPLYLGIAAARLLICTVVATLLCIRFIDRRPFQATGLSFYPRWGQHLVYGLFLGALLNSLPTILLIAFRQVNLSFDPSQIGPLFQVMILYVLSDLLVALNEEYLFRGYFFQLSIEGVGSWISATAIGLLFGLAHYKNPNGTIMGACGTGAWGVFLSYAYIKTRALWLPVGIHWSANFFEGVVWGMPTSGHTYVRTLFASKLVGSSLLTGGVFGPEAGLFTPLSVAIGFVIVRFSRRLRPAETNQGYWDRYIRPHRPTVIVSEGKAVADRTGGTEHLVGSP